MASNYSQASYMDETASDGPPRTIASAIGRVDGLHERLVAVRAELSKISEIIGGPRPVAVASKSVQTQPVGAVAKLNETADRCYDIVSDLESALSSIQRSLG